MTRYPLRSVAAVALPGVSPFELSVLCEVFGSDRTGDGVPAFDFAVVAERPGLVPAPEAVKRLVHETVERGARMLSICTAAFVLAEAGLLDGRPCTTHWMYTADLAAQYPRARVDPDVLYVDDGAAVTSAGTAAGIDACLHLARQAYGAALQEWALARLDEDLSVERLARQALVSPRTLARRFTEACGATPAAWGARMRLQRAQELLQTTSPPVDAIAAEVGWGTGAVLRHHFGELGTTPLAYRRTVAGPPAARESA